MTVQRRSPRSSSEARIGVARCRIRTFARKAASGRCADHEARALQFERVRLEVLPAAELDRVRQRIDATDVAWLAQRDPQALALAHREAGRPAMLPHPLAVDVDERPGLRSPAGTLTQRLAVVAAGHEADLLALGLVGGGEPETARDLADLRLGQLAEREPGVLELVLAQAVEEVGLVLVLVPRPAQPRQPVRPDVPAGVVTGRDRLAVVEVPGPTEQRPELDVRVAVDARARRPAVEVRVEERLQDAGVELALEVHDVERDVQLRGDPARVVGGVERTAALLELRVAVGDVVQAHPDADHVVALLVQQRRRDRRVDPARHRDQDPAHARTPCPSGSAATAAAPSRIEATTRGTISHAAAISSSVVVRPSDRRSAPRASSSG